MYQPNETQKQKCLDLTYRNAAIAAFLYLETNDTNIHKR